MRRLACHLLLLLPAGLVAQTDTDVARATERIAPRMIEIRHDIHQHPELSNRETRTAPLVADELRRLGPEVRTGVGKTGVVGIHRGGKPGPVRLHLRTFVLVPLAEIAPDLALPGRGSVAAWLPAVALQAIEPL